MMNRYPIGARVLIEAQAYARESLDHTMDYDGWTDGHKKMHRLIVGKAAQLWLAEFCRLNNVPHAKDVSSPYIADEQDMAIGGRSVDCKVSWCKGMWPQVSSNADRAAVDLYFFFRTNERFDYIQPIGVISVKAFREARVHVDKGGTVPGTSLTQRFGHSYFVSPDSLQPFDEAIAWLASNPRTSAGSIAA